MPVTFAQVLLDINVVLGLNPANMNPAGANVAILDASAHPNSPATVLLMASPQGVYVRPGTPQHLMLGGQGLAGANGTVILPNLNALNCTRIAVLVHELGHAYGWCNGGFALVGPPGGNRDETYACKKELDYLAMLYNSATLTGTEVVAGLAAFIVARIATWQLYPVKVKFYAMMVNCNQNNAATLWP